MSSSSAHQPARPGRTRAASRVKRRLRAGVRRPELDRPMSRGSAYRPTLMATYVLIPGLGGDAWYWHLVVPLLEAAGHRAVAVALPASDPDAGLDAYVGAALDAVGPPEGD